MLRGIWTTASLVSAVQVLSEGVLYAQGILAGEEKPGEKDADWIRICVPIFYAATRHVSEPCWRWVCGGYGGRMTTALGLAMVAVSAITASCQESQTGNLALVLLGGAGMGLVRLQIGQMKLNSEGAEWPLWGAGVTGIGLSFWPLLACLLVLKLGPRYAMLGLGGITLHGLPLALFVPTKREMIIREEDRARNPEDEAAVSMSMTATLPDVNVARGKYPLVYRVIEYDSYRVRPSYFVEVMPGIPEEGEYESDCELERDTQPSAEAGFREEGKTRAKNCGRKIERDSSSLETRESFAYAPFVAGVLLRLGDQFGLAIAISLLPSFAERLLPEFRMQEKAFLMSLCGFSRVLTEMPIVVTCGNATRTKFVALFGPFLGCVGVYLIWISTNLDAITLASFALGIGGGAASAALQLLAPKEFTGASEIADVAVGVALLTTIPLTRIFVLGDAVRGCFLVGAWIYAAAAIVMGLSMRRRT